MKRKLAYRTPFTAWCASLPLALGIPAIGWSISYGAFLLREPGGLRGIAGSVAIVGFAVLVHLLAYLVTGLPIFLRCFRNVNAPLWRPGVGIPLGAILGVLGYSLFFESWKAFLEPTLYLIGGGYGIVTAIAALRQRPTRE